MYPCFSLRRSHRTSNQLVLTAKASRFGPLGLVKAFALPRFRATYSLYIGLGQVTSAWEKAGLVFFDILRILVNMQKLALHSSGNWGFQECCVWVFE